MRPVVSILLGPEGLWIAISLVVYFVAAGNEPSTPAGNEFLETLWLAIPLGRDSPHIFDGLSAGRGRLVVAPSRGGRFVCRRVLVASFIAASGVDYHDSRNSGWLGAPVYSLSMGLLLLLPLTVLAAAVIVWKMNRARRR
jgi:hypothetical protein